MSPNPNPLPGHHLHYNPLYPSAPSSSSSDPSKHPNRHFHPPPHNTQARFYPTESAIPLSGYSFGPGPQPVAQPQHISSPYEPERGRSGVPPPSQARLDPKSRPHHPHHPYPGSRSPSDSRHPTQSRDSSVNSRNDTGADSSTPPPKSGRAGVKRRQKYSRTRTGCLSCRARRIKCGEERPICQRCIIAKKPCQYPDDGAASVSRNSSREDPERGQPGKRSRSSSEDTGSEDELVKVEAGPSSRPAHEHSNLTLPAFYAKHEDGILDQNDYNWDTSFIGNYEETTHALNQAFPDLTGPGVVSPPTGSGSESHAADISGEVMGMQQKYGLDGGAPMLSTPNFLLPWFPTAEERSLILHYCANAADLMMAIPSGLNPMLAINLPLALDSPRGMNISADALRVALLGIGAIHQAFLLARSGVSTTQTAAMFQYASNLRDMGKEMVRRAALEGGGARSDAALGAATALGTMDIFFGGSGWTENFTLAKEMVAFRGGPAAMLKASTPKQIADGVTISPARLMLEILAIYDVFGCLTTGEEPALLGDKYEEWWFENGQSTYEEHSVEKQFGMSRVMVHLFSRLTRLVSRVGRSNVLITESDSPCDLTLTSPQNESDQPPTPTTAWLTSLIKSASPAHPADPLVIEARKLNTDVDAWIESLQLSTLEHERVQVGNRAYAYAMKILLLRRVFKYPRDDARVQNAAQEVLKHCSTSTAILGMSIDLTWPAIIAGCCVNGNSRQWLLTLFEGFKSQCCFDIDTAARIISEVWRRVDHGEPRDDWKEVCDDLGLNVLLC